MPETATNLTARVVPIKKNRRDLHVYIPEQLHKPLRMAAAESDTTLNEMIIIILHDFFARKGKI